MLVDVLSLDVHYRWQFACCRCSCPVDDDMFDADDDVEPTILDMLFRLDGSILCLDVVYHDDVANVVDDILRVI